MQLILLWAWICLASFEIDLIIKCTGALNPKKGSKQTANSLGTVSYSKKKPLFHGVDAPLSLSLCIDAYQFPHLQRHNFLGARKFRRNDFHDISLMHITDLSKQRRAKHVHHHQKSFIRSTSKTSHPRSPRQDCKEDEVLLVGYEREKNAISTLVACTKHRKFTDQAENRKVRMWRTKRAASTIPASVASRLVATPVTQAT